MANERIIDFGDARRMHDGLDTDCETRFMPMMGWQLGERVVRCKDCKHYGYCRFFRTKKNKPQGFCAWGERREE